MAGPTPVKQAGECLLGLLLVWVSSWLLWGSLWGEPLLLLHPLRAPESLRILYLVTLYLGMLSLLVWLWRRHSPGIAWGGAGLALRAWIMGAAGILVQRLLLAGDWHPQSPSREAWLSAIFLAPLLALVEEAVFRGYLYGVLRLERGRFTSALLVSGIFALVHLFRPGGLIFKLAYASGLFLTGLVLVVVVERSGLAASVAMHSSWISANILDPPGRVESGWWSGLGGEPTAGVCAWLLLALMAWIYPTSTLKAQFPQGDSLESAEGGKEPLCGRA